MIDIRDLNNMRCPHCYGEITPPAQPTPENNGRCLHCEESFATSELRTADEAMSLVLAHIKMKLFKACGSFGLEHFAHRCAQLVAKLRSSSYEPSTLLAIILNECTAASERRALRVAIIEDPTGNIDDDAFLLYVDDLKESKEVQIMTRREGRVEVPEPWLRQYLDDCHDARDVEQALELVNNLESLPRSAYTTLEYVPVDELKRGIY